MVKAFEEWHLFAAGTRMCICGLPLNQGKLLEDTNLQSLVVVVSAPQVGFAAMNNRETVEFRPAPAATERGEDAKTGVDDTHLGTEAENRPYFGYSSVFCFSRLFCFCLEITNSYLLQMQIVCFI